MEHYYANNVLPRIGRFPRIHLAPMPTQTAGQAAKVRIVLQTSL